MFIRMLHAIGRSRMNNEEKKQNSGKGELKIAYQNKDVTSKLLAEEFKGKSFAVYGVDLPDIVRVEPTNLPAIEANELRMDNLFYLADGSYLLVDYESEYNEANKVKYLSYVVRVSQRLYNELKKYPKVRMLVIYTADVKRGSTNPEMDIGSNKFEITEAFLSELDHDEIWSRVTRKVCENKDFTSQEMMELIVYPLSFKKREDKQNAIRDVIYLVGKISDNEIKRFILKCLLVFTDKVIDKADIERIEEVLMLTQVEKVMYEKEAIRIAKNLIKRGIDNDAIIEDTGLSKDKVIELYNSIVNEKE